MTGVSLITEAQRTELARLRDEAKALRRVNAELRAEVKTLRPLLGEFRHRIRLEQEKTWKQKQRAELWKHRALNGR